MIDKIRVLGRVITLSVALSAAQALDAQAVTRTTAATPAPLTAAQKHAILTDPKRAFWSAHAPATVTADVETSRGTVTIELIRAWAPVGVDHFYNLARAGYYDDSRFYRVINGFIAQFGIAGEPAIARAWIQRKIPSDSSRELNVRGTLTYAQFSPTTRSTNLFFNLRDNPSLDTLHFAPIGRVVQGMAVVDSLMADYGDFPSADEPLGNPKRLYAESNKYLDEKFPKLDRILKITIRPDTTTAIH